MASQGGGRRATLALILPAALVALLDWGAVAAGRIQFELVLKPLVPLLLAIGASTAGRWWFTTALVLCLAGDVLLLPQVDRFRSGLAAFLAGHVAFIVGLLGLERHPLGLLAVPLLLLVGLGVGPPLLRAAPRSLRAPVTAYMLVILAMAAAAAATLRPAAIAGAGLFVASDTLLAWNRFRSRLPTGRLGVMVTYHLALGLLTIAAWS